ncbi:putative undecaprenyl-phosphate N-acetylglucosaminyl 1-phosphate transferase [Candidatus Arcanobacter lacustris]|uniref:Putative undecaprenyl-phosphate N-acetylglucosaminyl 1-phosphate transferase n=1 Tax=Candidatus Arcanibacter lacustris TaxID=1607817 RepID=A0A0F5MNA1_9RICK|nr:putative undecaprenyl-phosphate N-acetylglucosaminyl 1-phosphate transferase [Candidatus Arcanobacter lacustris]
MSLYFALLASFILVLIGTTYLISYLLEKNILDVPNNRSNHHIATPRGGGILIIISILLGSSVAGIVNMELIILLFGALFLSIVGFVDDRFDLPIYLRLSAQVFVSLAVISNIPADILIFKNYLPSYIEKSLMILALIYFMNCFNFMDGIDGIASSESIHIALSIFILSFFVVMKSELKHLCLIIIVANLAFLRWNWHKAKIFMGDSGSVSLGFILGWLLIKLALAGGVLASLIIPLYFLSDSLITMGKRLFNGEKIWQAHSKHFYQIAVRNGVSHDLVVKYIWVANIFLTIVAIISIYYSLLSIILAAFTIYMIISHLKKSGPTK